MFKLLTGALSLLTAFTSASSIGSHLRAQEFEVTLRNSTREKVNGLIKSRNHEFYNNEISTEHSKRNTDFIADFNGESGSFKLFMQKDGKDTKSFWNIKYSSLTELNPDGTPSRNRRISRLPFQLTGQGSYNDGELIYDWVTLEATVVSSVVGSVYISVFHAIYYTPALITLPDNDTMVAPENAMKISLEIRGWQFAPNSAGLVLKIKASSNKRGEDDDYEQDNTNSTIRRRLQELPSEPNVYLPPESSVDGYVPREYNVDDPIVTILPVEDYVPPEYTNDDIVTKLPVDEYVPDDYVKYAVDGYVNSTDDYTSEYEYEYIDEITGDFADIVSNATEQMNAAITEIKEYIKHEKDTVSMDSGDGVLVNMKFEGIAYIDETYEKHTVTTSMEGKNIIRIELPPFRYSCWYDPTISTVDSLGSGASSIALSLFSIALLVVSFIVTV